MEDPPDDAGAAVAASIEAVRDPAPLFVLPQDAGPPGCAIRVASAKELTDEQVRRIEEEVARNFAKYMDKRG